MKRIVLIWLLVGIFFTISAQKDFSPFSFGLSKARSDIERFQVLYNTHAAAIEAGVNVNYAGIDTLYIEIPPKAKRIPLTQYNDFQNVVFFVKNQAQTFYLFDMQQRADTLLVEKSLLDSLNFSSIPQLAHGSHLLIIEDQTPWVGKRDGYNYGATRRDLLLIHNGKSENRPISSYNNPQSQPICTYCAVTETPKVIKNLTIHRTPESTYKTYAFNILRQHNVQFENIAIYTPKNEFYGDAAFNITHCSHLSMNQIHIDGTYSQTNHYGYGIQLNNLWNCCFENMNAHANWGIFGTNNINNALLINCDINRFDIHCYGRDIIIQNCQFSKLYNQFSSVYGQVNFINCSFSDFIPVLFEPSYNAYTRFDLKFTNCTFNATSSRYFLIQAGKLDNNFNNRPELQKKCLPNITIKNLIVNIPANVPKIVLLQPKGAVSEQLSVGYINQIKIDGIYFKNEKKSNSATFSLSSAKIQTERSLSIDINALNLIPADRDFAELKNKNNNPAELILNINHNPQTDIIQVRNSNLIFNISAHSKHKILFEQSLLGLRQCTTPANSKQRIYRRCDIYTDGGKKEFCIDEMGTFEYCNYIFGKKKSGSSLFNNESNSPHDTPQPNNSNPSFYKKQN